MECGNKKNNFLREAFEQLESLPQEDVADILADQKTKELLKHFYTIAREKAAQPAQLRFSQLNYRPYKPRTDALAHLETYFKDCLTYFGAEEDTLFQDQLRKIDETLLIAVDSRQKYLRKIGRSDLKTADIIKPKSVRLTKEIEKLSSESLEKYARTGWAYLRRKNRKSEYTV